jgi:hypothetical protein
MDQKAALLDQLRIGGAPTGGSLLDASGYVVALRRAGVSAKAILIEESAMAVA